MTKSRKKGKISEWTSMKVKECYEKVASEDIGRLSIAQDILAQKRRFSDKNHCARQWSWRNHLVVRVPSLSLLPA